MERWEGQISKQYGTPMVQPMAQQIVQPMVQSMAHPIVQSMAHQIVQPMEKPMAQPLVQLYTNTPKTNMNDWGLVRPKYSIICTKYT